MTFADIIDHVLESEGGSKITKDPLDPGGTTKYGISQRAYPNTDIENLTEGEKFYRVWKDGEFQLYEVPIVQKDGSIILPKDTLSNISEEVESNIDIKSTDYKKWDKFWNNHSVTQYIIKGGFEIIDEKE